MSLVTTAISYRSRSARQSESVSAVLPEPTGPPMPTRKGCWMFTLSRPNSNDAARAAAPSRPAQPRILRLVARAGETEPRSERRQARIVDRHGRCDDAWNLLAQSDEQPLSGDLAQRHQLDRCQHLVFEPRADVAMPGSVDW